MSTTRTGTIESRPASKQAIRRGGGMQPSAVIHLLQSDFGFSQPMVVRLSGYSPRSIASWSKGVKASEPARRRFAELDRLLTSLAGLMEEPAEVAEWLQEPNPAFEGSTPLQVIERGETDRIWRMVYAIESGDPG